MSAAGALTGGRLPHADAIAGDGAGGTLRLDQASFRCGVPPGAVALTTIGCGDSNATSELRML